MVGFQRYVSDESIIIVSEPYKFPDPVLSSSSSCLLRYAAKFTAYYFTHFIVMIIVHLRLRKLGLISKKCLLCVRNKVLRSTYPNLEAPMTKFQFQTRKNGMRSSSSIINAKLANVIETKPTPAAAADII